MQVSSPMEDHHVPMQHNNETMTNDGKVNGVLQEVAISVFMGGIFLFLLLWLWLGLRSYIQNTLRRPRRIRHDHQATNTDEIIQKLPSDQRQQRLVQYFENGKHEMVRCTFVLCLLLLPF